MLSLLCCGCIGGAAVHQAPAARSTLSPHRVEQTWVYEARLDPVRAPAPDVRVDEILASPVLLDASFEEAVGEWIGYWQSTASRWVPDYLARMASYGQAIDSALLADDLPASLRYLPFIESGYSPVAASPARAVGMWQFMEPTARELGMEVSRLLDERRDPVRSTEAAVRFLSQLREDLGSWFLALAAYNGGPNRARRILRQHAPDVEPSDSLFWALRREFPRETRDFLPKLVAAVIVAERPEEYGYERPEAVSPFRYDQVLVPDATTLDVVAFAAGVSLQEIERLNPQLVRGMTPPGRPSMLRVPAGRGPDFEQRYAEIPPEERVTFVEHRVVQGETLSHIAVRYGVLLADLRAANPGLRERYLRIGAMLTVPVAPSVRGGAAGS